MLILDNGLPILLTGTGAPSGRISGSRLKGTVLYSGGASLYKTKIRFRRKEVKSTPSPPSPSRMGDLDLDLKTVFFKIVTCLSFSFP